MNIQILPSKIEGVVEAPPSKSSSQRYLMMALSKEQSHIRNIGMDDDTKAVLSVLSNLPFNIEHDGNDVKLKAEWMPNLMNIGTWKNELYVELGESGFALRTLAFLLPLYSQKVVIKRQGTLLNRDFSELIELLTIIGLKVSFEEEFLIIKGFLNLTKVCKLSQWPVLSSSQFLSGFLILRSHLINLNLINIDEELHLGVVPSWPYVVQTIEHLEEMGLPFPEFDNNILKFKSVLSNNRVEVFVQKDWSAAALLMAGAISTNSSVVIKNLDLFRKQADQKVLEALQDMGLRLSIEAEQITIFKTDVKKAFHIDLTHAPDLFPALAVMATQCEGTTVLEGVHRLKNKESNRAAAISEALTILGINVKIQDDLLLIVGGESKGGKVSSYQDHRMAMALSLLGINSTEPVIVENIKVINKSYPEFFNDMASLGLSYEFQ